MLPGLNLAEHGLQHLQLGSSGTRHLLNGKHGIAMAPIYPLRAAKYAAA
jgi:hypothetical protein